LTIYFGLAKAASYELRAASLGVVKLEALFSMERNFEFSSRVRFYSQTAAFGSELPDLFGAGKLIARGS